MLRFIQNHRGEKGDTLIEVLFAVTVFSAIVVASLNLMNQGVTASERSLEITAVRQQMDGQAETLRFLHESYVAAYQSGITYNTTTGPITPAEEYYKIIQYAQSGGRTSASQFAGSNPCSIPADPSKDFILNPITATVVTASTKPDVFQVATTSAQLTYTVSGGTVLDHSQGIWIEPIRSAVNGTNPGYIDFHIRACWEAPGLNAPMHLGTIVRLYEPRG
jgi:type II secretory pathway pseudopilin PulG